MAYFTQLPKRGLISLTGEDRFSFLQGMISNDVEPVKNGKAVWAAYLSPQGKYRHDFFVVPYGDALLLDCEGGDRLMDLGTSLRRHVLRAEVALGMGPRDACIVAWGKDMPAVPEVSGGIVFTDPRHDAMGVRVFAPLDKARSALTALGFTETDWEAWDRHRIKLGVPDGSRDLVPDKSILLENGFDELNGIDWDKGCYVGQELTARTRYRGLVKKRLLPVTIVGPSPDEGTQVLANGKDAGTLFSVSGQIGLALLRVAALKEQAPLEANDARLYPEYPDWFTLPD